MSGSFSSAAGNQVRALYSVFLIEAYMRFSRRSLGVIEEIGGIVIHILGLAALRLFSGVPTHHGMPILPFLATGVFSFWILKTTMQPVSSMHVMKSRYHVLPRVTQLDVAVARGAVNGLLYLFISFSSFYLMYFTGLSAWMERPWEVLAVFLVAILWGFGIGLCFGALYTVMPFMRTLMGGVLRMFMYFSGIFYIWPEVPYSFRFILVDNPMFHLLELMRSAYFKSYESPVADWGFVLKWVTLTLVLGLVFERSCRAANERDTRKKTAEDDAYAMDMM